MWKAPDECDRRPRVDFDVSNSEGPPSAADADVVPVTSPGGVHRIPRMAGICDQTDRVVVGIEDLELASSVQPDAMAKNPSARESARGGGAGPETG
jgi:hypothetical protein